MKSEIYEITREGLLVYKINSDTEQMSFKIYGIDASLSRDLFRKYEKFYIQVNRKNDDKIVGIKITPYKPFEYNGLTITLEELLSDREKIIKKEDVEMIEKYGDYKVKGVILKDIKDVAFVSAIKGLIDSGDLGDATIEKEEGKNYYVEGGYSTELSSIAFKERVEKFLIGKTLRCIEATSNNTKKDKKEYILAKLIDKLGIVKEITLEKEEKSLF